MAASPIPPPATPNHGLIAVPDAPSIPIAPSPWWRIADFGVLGLWVAVVAFILPYHEKWADEAQAWLIARDLSLKAIWFHELRYEGSPGLWHTILWIAQHVFHAHYDSLGLIGAAGALAGVALLIFEAPFPRYIRWPLAFTYFMVYQYAVIARPYTLMPLLAFAAALLFKDRDHPERMTVILVLLANLSLHGTILAGCLGSVYLLDAIRGWSAVDAAVKRRYWISSAVMVATFAFLFVILKPTPDVNEFALKKEFAKLPAEVRLAEPDKLVKLETVVSGAFFDYWLPSTAFILFAAWWCSLRRRLFVFAVPVGLLIALYAFIHGYAHHHGTVFIAAITALWIAWPCQEETRSFGIVQQLASYGMAAVLVCLCALNIWDAEGAIRNEYLYPYSGAHDAASYIKSVGADRAPMFGFLFGVNAVEAYFDNNIFANLPSAYFHLGLPLTGVHLDFDELHRVNPEYIVAYSDQPDVMVQEGVPILAGQGYKVVRFFDGYYFYKRSVYKRETYFIFRRVRP